MNTQQESAMKIEDKESEAAAGGHLFETPRVIRKSPPLPSLMHLCSYASSHTEASTCTLYGVGDKGMNRYAKSDQVGR